ncbi:hypothetical protein GA830_10245 [Mesorhizobium sp. NBSH29]|uniref:hypothetical protein n=1 Tax=Mesorhizobium sp. NBSH29 TaxID=2654249 RepID=UPI00189676CF|nr:hypothetical protein [Mesorhizobium sp. NBSH29]QPC87075.1 hypothetical protein GA830_10245 [Mesorhizobium sp. NBSH29]
MRTGDHVYHKPSEETWVVAWADPISGFMAPCGWPECQAKISDCEVVKVATDDEAANLVDRLSLSGRRDSKKAAEIAARATYMSEVASAALSGARP